MQKETKSSLNDDVQVLSIINNQKFNRPCIAEVKYNEQKYFVLLDSVQMSQMALEGYAQSRSVKNYRPITLEGNEIKNIKEAIENLIKQGYNNFVIPFISTDKNSGSGHTVYVIGNLKENKCYHLTLLDQTKTITEDNKQKNNHIIAEVKKVVENGGMQVEKSDIINGAFPSESNIASCTEMGALLIDTMVDKSYDFFPDIIETATILELSIADIARIRVQSLIHSLEKGQTVENFMNNVLDFAFLEKHEAEVLKDGKIQLPNGNVITKEEFFLGCNLGLPEFNHIDSNKRMTLKATIVTPVCALSFLSKHLNTQEGLKNTQDKKETVPPTQTGFLNYIRESRLNPFNILSSLAGYFAKH